MDKLYMLLYTLNNEKIKSQRELADRTSISLGMINSLLKSMKKENYISFESCDGGKSQIYKLMPKGHEFLENMLKETRDQRIVLPNQSYNKIKSAVILAAGQRKDFDMPVGLLQIDGIYIIDRIVNCLIENLIENICLITGFKSEEYETHFKHNESVKIMENKRYKWTGTMHSLNVAAPFIEDDFILVESDQLFEGRAIKELINFDKPNALLLSNITGSDDEAYVELNDDNSIFKISKDKHQINNMAYEMLGISKISKLLFDKMIQSYKYNRNPYVNYEYVIENIGRMFKVPTLKIDNLIWCDIDTSEQFKTAVDKVYPELCRREQHEKEEFAYKTVKDIMELEDNDIESLSFAGGMTNTNFLVKSKGESYILRIPGACTQTMISRKNEKYNSKLATLMGLNPETIYFNEDSGIKISRFIEEAETLNSATAKIENNIKMVTELLSKLHNSKFEFQNEFNVFREYEKYKNMAAHLKIKYYDKFFEAEEFFFKLEGELKELGENMKPCHIDTVPENFIKDKYGKLYLIDWEYSGMNDPMWDVAAYILECGLTDEQEDLFLSYYYKDEISNEDKQKILIFKICQDMLWSLWTLVKEANGEEFGKYGKNRFYRGLELILEYEVNYANK